MTFVQPPPQAEYTDIVEAAFGYTRDVDSATWVWTDITKYVRGAITITKGRPDATSTADPTHIQLTLENTDGRFTKGNPLSPYWPYVVRGVPLRVRRTWKNATTSYERATAFVGGWPVTPVAGVRYVETQIDAWGRLRQLRRDSTLIASPMTRTVKAAAPTAHWPLEDLAGATSAVNTVTGGRRMTIAGNVTFGEPGPPGALAGVDFSEAGQLIGVVPSASSGSVQIAFGLKLDDLTSTRTVMRVDTSSGAKFIYNAFPQTQIVTIDAYDVTGASPGSLGSDAWTGWDTGWHLHQFTLVQSGGDVQSQLVIDGVAIGPTATVTGLTLGRITRITLGQPPTLAGAVLTYQISEVEVFAPAVLIPTNGATLSSAFFGFDGESATTRMTRLGTENSVPVTTAAGIGTPQPLGPQPVDTLGNQFDAAADADCGLLHDGGTLGALYYASPGARYNVAPQLTIAYAQSQISDGLAGTDDDQTLTNDVTISRTNGSSGEWVNTASATGEGRITGQDTLDLHDDDQPDHVAQFRANLSAFDAMRFPFIPIDVRRNPELAQAITGLTLPAYLAITGVPSPFPAASIDQFVEGYTEVLDAVTWQIVFNCSPAAPWRVGQLDDATNPFRCDADWTAGATPGAVTSQLVVNAGVSATATSFGLKTLSGPLVTTSAGDFPVLIEDPATGEVMRLTNVTGGSSPQTATVVRSINGVVKALGTNDPIRLYRPATLAL